MAPDGRSLTPGSVPGAAEAEEPRDDDEQDDGNGSGGGPKLEIPKPILIIVIVVIALGIVSCAVGGLRGLTDPEPSVEPGLVDRVDDLLDPQRIPANELGLAGINGGSCNRFGAIIQVSGTCRILVDARILPQRELRVRVESGTATVVARQEVRGRLEQSDAETFIAVREFDVSGGGTSDIEVFVACGGGGCDLRVLQ